MTANGFLQRSRGLCPNAPGELKGYSAFMKHFKYRRLMTLPATDALGLSFLTVGCERTVSQTEDGTVESKEKKVTENPDGTVTKPETKKTEKP